MKQRNLFLVICLFNLIGCTTPQPYTGEGNTSFAVMAYYIPNDVFPPDQLPLDRLTHIIYAFSHVVDGEMAFRHQQNDLLLQNLVAQKTNFPDLKVMIACGGWGADGFSDMASTPHNREKFIRSTIAFVERYQLDGVDIDCQNPVNPTTGTRARPEDTQNFTALMKGLREALDQLDRPQTLSFASAGWEGYYDNVEVQKVMQYANYMNIMTYDQVVGTSPTTGHHTALGLIEMEDLAATTVLDTLDKYNPGFYPHSAEGIVKFLLDQGVQPQQMIIGGAFYGRAWKGVNPTNQGLYQANQGTHTGWLAYQKIRAEYENKNGFNRFWDPVAKAPYLFSPTERIFITYDDPESLKQKTIYAQEQNLGGIMFWQLSLDTPGEYGLLDAIWKEVEK
ncbi:MAG: glycoside hydrolase family 18 protein [Saprospiraceae bacterium]|nr:glycoside hydrolase family 18 protein [Saprospiraceae bacterium]